MSEPTLTDAMEALTVETRPHGDAIQVYIDMDEVPGIHGELALTLRGTVLKVRRPPGLSRTSHKLWMQPTHAYDWTGGVGTDSDTPPVHYLHSTRKQQVERLLNAPVHAALRRAVHETEGRPDRHLKKEVTRIANQLWSEMWRQLHPHLDAEAASLTARHGLPWSTYQKLVESPRLREIARDFPGLGPRMTYTRWLREDISDGEAVNRLLGYETSVWNEDGSRHTQPMGESEAFHAWARNVPADGSTHPVFKLPDEEEHRDIHDEPWELMKRVAQAAMEGAFTAADLDRLQTPLQWLLFHTAVVRTGNVFDIQRVLKNPPAAEAAFRRAFDFRGSLARRAVLAQNHLREVDGWIFSARHRSDAWSEKLDDETIPAPHKADLAPTYFQAVRLLRRMRLIRTRAHKLQGTTDHALGRRLLAWCDRKTARTLVSSEHFTMTDEDAALLLARRSLRRDPVLRDALLAFDDLAVPGLNQLLVEGPIAEIKPLWARLAHQSREAAIEYLEAVGFHPDVDWHPADLEPLFRGGGELNIRATVLLGQLKNVLEETPEEVPESRPDQGELFGGREGRLR